MEALKKLIDESTALGKRLLAENHHMTSVVFELTDLSVEDIHAAAIAYEMIPVEFRNETGRFSTCHCPKTGIFIHLRSIKVKAKLVYDEDVTVLK